MQAIDWILLAIQILALLFVAFSGVHHMGWRAGFRDYKRLCDRYHLPPEDRS